MRSHLIAVGPTVFTSSQDLQPQNNWCLESKYALSRFHLSPALATPCGSCKQGGDSQWSSHTPMKDTAKGSMSGRPGRGEALARAGGGYGWGGTGSVTHQANMFAQQGPMALGRVFHFQCSGPGSYHKYFLQLTFLATLKLFQRVT